MNVDYSKAFIKAAQKLSGKMRLRLSQVIDEVERAQRIDEITNCVKLVNFDNTYRIRINNYRAIFIHIEKENNLVVFEVLVSRGQVYTKKSACCYSAENKLV